MMRISRDVELSESQFLLFLLVVVERYCVMFGSVSAKLCGLLCGS